MICMSGVDTWPFQTKNTSITKGLGLYVKEMSFCGVEQSPMVVAGGTVYQFVLPALH